MNRSFDPAETVKCTSDSRCPSGPNALVIGEALIDIVHFADGEVSEHVGGSPANVAVGIARLGVAVELVAALADDARGRRIVAHVERSGASVRSSSFTLARTSTATATLGADGQATYVFDIGWHPPEDLDSPLATLVHAGSLALFLDPGADTVISALRSARSRGAIISIDPNIRPALLTSHSETLARFERAAALSHIIKLSDEDAAWLYPGASTEDVAVHLRSLGVDLIAVTAGSSGARLFSAAGHAEVVAPSVEVRDTVGAGDSFQAALLAWVLENEKVAELTSSDLAELGAFAVAAAAVTVQRAGADPPTSEEVAPPRVTLHAVFTSRPGQAEQVASLLRDYTRAVRQEPGNVLFEASRLADEPDRFFVYESYRDDAAFRAHLAHPAGAAFNEKLGPLIVEPASELTFLRRLP